MLIYFSPVGWHDFDQRSHEYVRAFHRVTGKKVVWIEPYPTRLPQIKDLFRGGTLKERKEIPAWLNIIHPRVLPIEPLWGAKILNQIFFKRVLAELPAKESVEFIAVGKPSRLAIVALTIFSNAKKIYDAMDDFPFFYKGISSLSMAKVERILIDRVDLISVSSTHLLEKFSRSGKPTHLLLNACSGKFLSLPLRNPSSYTAVFGYIGTIAEWFDWRLVVKIAMAFPHARVRLIGPIYKAPPSLLPDNIEIETAVNHDAAIKEMIKFDVGLIPFLLTPLTKSVDPIKYYEYLACGIPTISTRFGEMVQRSERDGVWLVDAESDLSFIENILGESRKVANYQKIVWGNRFDPFFQGLV